MWKNVQTYFPDVVAINSGFGGSEISDLLYYYKEAILMFKPSKVFIYEGDNDIAGKKDPQKIVKTFKDLLRNLKKESPELKIVIISTKPSLSRWHFKDEYIKLNKLMEGICSNEPNVEFANVWDIMISDDKTPLKDVFLEDGLHMNKKGYDLWYHILKEFID
jgi:lysophospholipase L1-like esterase